MSRARANPIRTYSAVPTHTETVVPMPAPTTPIAGMPAAGHPKMSSSETVMLTKCITKSVFM